VLRLTEREALANVRAVLELCAAGELRCSDKTSRPTAAAIRTIDAHLVHGDFYADERIATVAWSLLVQAGGLAKLDGTRLQLSAKGRVALGKPAAEAICQLWQRWLTHALIDEFGRIEQIKGQRGRNVLTAAKPRRQTVAVALADCPLGEWIGIDDLFTARLRRSRAPYDRNRNARVLLGDGVAPRAASRVRNHTATTRTRFSRPTKSPALRL
jgi:hypothetical protein